MEVIIPLAVLGAAIYFWQYSLGLGVVWLIYKGIQNAIDSTCETNERQEAKRREELARIEAHKKQQQKYYENLLLLGQTSFQLFEAMPDHLLTTERLLDEAETEFEEGAFAPFWDYVEQAVMQLGRFNESVQSIHRGQ